MIRTIEELEESIEAVQPQLARVTLFPRELKKFSSFLCELKEWRTLVFETRRRDAAQGRLWTRKSRASQGVRSVARGLSIPKQFLRAP